MSGFPFPLTPVEENFLMGCASAVIRRGVRQPLPDEFSFLADGEEPDPRDLDNIALAAREKAPRLLTQAGAFVTLHVGLGTFRPVSAERVVDHKMHSEHYLLPQETADAINRTKATGGRVIAVGTTSCRTLESVAAKEGCIKASEGWTDIFIYPGFQFQVLDGLITNFHLPQSTLIMLVSALAGYDHIMNAYRIAVQEKYRFFSFGDAMLII